MKTIGFLYGVISYVAFLASFLYAIGFVGNLPVPKSIDSGPAAPVVEALLVDSVLLGLFAIQHSVMARPAFKRWWTRVIAPPVERSTYVLLSSLLLGLLFWKWQALPAVIWSVDNPGARMILDALFWAGWLIVLLSTFMINHFDLFGLRQVYLRMRDIGYTQVPFMTHAFYRFVRHPIMLGFLVAFWATPRMTAGHLLFSLATTGYIFIGILLEERDAAALHGDAFRRYRETVPMMLPVPGHRAGRESAGTHLRDV